MVNKSTFLGLRLPPRIKEIVKKLANSQQMNESEYVRMLIYQELQRLSILTTSLEKAKKELFEEAESNGQQQP
jgi:hypothetical protein